MARKSSADKMHERIKAHTVYDLFSNATIESNSNRLTLYNHVLDYL